ncbi:MAG: hypothetical protein HY350_04330 [Candidatus Omnitrophica bacterium]|nr:hypothetical protein [Candidatus Omnitrophota bacterium]
MTRFLLVLFLSLFIFSNLCGEETNNEIYFLKGLYYEYYKIEQTAGALGLGIKSSVFTHFQGVSKLTPLFPNNPEDLSKFKLIVIANVNAEPLEFRGRQALEKAVREDGVGLLIFGEYFSFGPGDYQKGILAKLLPVEVTGTYDLKSAENPMVLTPAAGKTVFQALSWADKPSVFWFHDFSLKPGVDVMVNMGDKPFFVTHSYGKGKVGVITGTVLGKKNANSIPFWEWKDFPKFMNEAIKALIKL